MTDSAKALGPLTVVRRGIRLLPPHLQRRLKTAVALAVVLAFVEAAAFAALFLLIQLIADGGGEVPDAVFTALGSPSDRDAVITRLGAVTLALLLARSTGALLLLRRQAAVQSETDAELAKRLYSAFLATPYSALAQRNSADTVVNIAYRVPDVAANSVGVVIGLAADIAVLTGVVATLVLVAPALAIGVVLYFAAVATGLLKVLTPAVRSSAFEEGIEANAAQQSLQEGVGGVKAIKANEMAPFFSERFRERRESLRVVRQRRIFLGRLPSFYLETSLYLGLALLAVVVFRLGRNDVVTTFGVLVAATLRTLPSVNRIIGSITGIRGSEPSLRAVEAELGLADDLDGTGKSGHYAGRLGLSSHLELRDLSFTYPGGVVPAVSGVSVEVGAGQAIGVVGGSGAGKTTLVDVILGLLEPTGGSLVVDGQELRPEDLPSWRRSIGYVPQDVYLLDGSLRANVIFGREGVSERHLEEAVDVAQLRELVDSLPGGLDAEVGERGGRLSGGQRQRLGIARALLGQPSLLILDEATSSLDNKTEAAVTEAIAALKGRTTTIVIAHRLSTVSSCDQILLLDGGMCIGQGSFDELQRQSAAFAELVRLGKVEPA